MEIGHHNLLAQVASMYYEQGMTQNKIAAELGLSRVKIYRLLKEARAEQVVQIAINWPIDRDRELEGLLKVRFGLKEALVLQSIQGSKVSALQRLGQLGARYLEQVLNTTNWQEISTMFPQAQKVVEELEEAGDRKAFLAKGDYDRAETAFQECDHDLARTYLEKVLAIPEPVITCVLTLSLLSLVRRARKEKTLYDNTS